MITECGQAANQGGGSENIDIWSPYERTESALRKACESGCSAACTIESVADDGEERRGVYNSIGEWLHRIKVG